MTADSRSALLLHGLGASAEAWWAVADALGRAGWHVTTPELRGHGTGIRAADYSHDAYADDALAIGTPPWDLVVGHSLGAAIAVRAAARGGSWTRRLALIDPVLHLPEELRAEVRAGELTDLNVTAEQIATAKPHWHERDRAAKLSGARAADPAAVAATVDQNTPWDVRPDAARLTIPTLVLAGDPAVFTFFGTAAAAELLRANPRVRYAPIAGTGHAPHRDDPETTVAALLEWAGSDLTASRFGQV
ncbi:alpha/beta hydrolase [Microbacteriaceae bacterium VKM Ac-2854]|nr:alpha/beta hydrolase [Microbacteriaceae bacterium VKM Ac-2854]